MQRGRAPLSLSRPDCCSLFSTLTVVSSKTPPLTYDHVTPAQDGPFQTCTLSSHSHTRFAEREPKGSAGMSLLQSLGLPAPARSLSLWVQHQAGRYVNTLQVWFMSQVTDVLRSLFDGQEKPNESVTAATINGAVHFSRFRSHTSDGDLQPYRRHSHLKKEVI